MKIHFLLLIILSAFLHAFYNFLMRRQEGRRLFLLAMFSAACLPSLATPLLRGSFAQIPWRFVPYVVGASFFYILYQFLVCKAYETGNISRCYPLTVLSPALIPFWAFFLLEERISFLDACGILLTLAGAVLVKLDSLSIKEFSKLFTRAGEYKGPRFALAASVAYSFGAVLDKARIASFPLDAYLAVLILSMTINGFIFFFLLERNPSAFLWRDSWRGALLGGMIVYGSFFSFRIALREVPVSIAVPARQAAVIFAILLGVLFLREKFKIQNLTGSLAIIAGVALTTL